MMARGRGAAGHAVTIAAIAACALATCVLAQQPSAPQPPGQQPAPQQAAAQPAAAPNLKGDPHRGKELSYTCLGCHGIDGYRNAYPEYSVPKLEGQNPEYLVAALHGYRDGDRAHITMHSQALMLSDQDIADIASYFAGKPLASAGTAPRPVPKAVTLCTSCHGHDGIAVAPMYPSLAGQHEDYLVRAIEEYRNGGRKNAVMKGFAANLKPEDIEVIARYFSSLTPALRTEPRPYTRFSAE
jgi:cytochrome c553